MPDYAVNERAVDQAIRLIDREEYDTETPWSEAAPSTDQANDIIDNQGYDGFGTWHVGIDTGASEETKGRYAFPYGDFSQVNRAALIHGKQRASQNDHRAIVDAFDRLLEHLDEVDSR